MQIEILESTVSDNWFYLVHDGAVGALIDPVDPTTAIDAVKRTGVRLEWVVNTHWHPDHTGGNDAVFSEFADARLCAGPDHTSIAGARSVEEIVAHGDTLTVGALKLDILETPGHTAGHISLLADGHLFSGDTIFVGGAGNCRFGGDPSVLFRTFRDVVGALDDEVTFYPGHDYSVRNAEFALSLQPDHEVARRMLGRAKNSNSVLLTTLGTERTYNPFFRADEPALQQALVGAHGELWSTEREQSDDDAEATFRTIRALRNSW